MRKNEYVWTIGAIYFLYLTLGIQTILISQNIEMLSQQWATDMSGIYSVIAYTGLARFISIPVCGILCDKIGRKLMILAGAVLYIAFFAGLISAQSYASACIWSFLGGLAVSFFDSSCFPALIESSNMSSGTAAFIINGIISVSFFFYPLISVFLTASRICKTGLLIPLMTSIIVLVMTIISPFYYDLELKNQKKFKDYSKLSKVLKKNNQIQVSRTVIKPSRIVTIGCIMLSFAAMTAMYTSLQFLTRYGHVVLEMGNLKSASLTCLFALGSLISSILLSFLVAKLRWRNIKILLYYFTGTVLSYMLLYFVNVHAVAQIASFTIGFFTAGGLMQCCRTLIIECNTEKISTKLGISYLFIGLAAYATPSFASILTHKFGENQALTYSFLFALVISIISACFVFFIAFNYSKWFGVSLFSKIGEENH